MLKLSLKPGEYLMIGEDVRVIFTGGAGNNIRVMVDAPRSVPVVRSRAAEKAGQAEPVSYYRDADLSAEAKRQIEYIISQDRRRSRQAEKEAAQA